MKKVSPKLTLYIIIVVIVITLGTASYLYKVEFKDILGNLFAGSCDALLIYFLIDKLIELDEKRRTRPARFQIYNQTRRVYKRIERLWIMMVIATVKEEPDRYDDLLFNTTYSEEVKNKSDLSSTYPEKSFGETVDWRMHIQSTMEDIVESMKNILQTYPTFTPPEFHSIFNELIESYFVHSACLLLKLSKAAKINGHQPGDLLPYSLGEEEREILVKLRKYLIEMETEFRDTQNFVPLQEDLNHKLIQRARNSNWFGASRVQ